MFLNSLSAQTAGASAGGSLQMILPLVIVFGIMYFLIIRPQNKRMKEQQTMQSSIKVGDTIATTGGLIGRVTKLDEKEIHVDFNRSGQSVRVLRTAIVGIMDTPNKAKAMTQSGAADASKSTEKATEGSKENTASKPRTLSPMNRGRAGGNRRPAPKKTEE